MNNDQKRDLVLELFAQDVETGLDAALVEKRQELVHFIEKLWDKYRVTLTELRSARNGVDSELTEFLKRIAYV
jgi:type I restriction enzyme M protein